MSRVLLRLLSPLLAATLVTACQTPAAAPANGIPAMPDTDARVRIQGEAMYLEKILLPEDARLRVQVIDTRRAETPDAVIAEQVTTVGNGPYEFTIDVPRARLRDGGLYGLHASVLMPGGEARFVTDTRVPLTINAGSTDVHVGRVRLRHVQPD